MTKSLTRWESDVDVLLDTHIAIWAMSDAPALSAAAKNVILNGANEIFVSDISAWEVAVKRVAKPDAMPFGAREFMEACIESGYRWLPVTHDAIVAYEDLDYDAVGNAHRDPFDRLLIAQAKTSSMLFLTHDSILQLYGEPLVSIV